MPEIVTSGDGLYESTEPDKYIYKGANPNNYIWLDENKDTIKQGSETYRIISYESDGTIKVIRDTSIGNYAWDARTDATTGTPARVMISPPTRFPSAHPNVKEAVITDCPLTMSASSVHSFA